jgi:hypothetical protein
VPEFVTVMIHVAVVPDTPWSVLLRPASGAPEAAVVTVVPSVAVTGLSAGRTRRVRVVAWSGYGVKHSRIVNLTTTDTQAPTVRALAVRGRVGQAVRLRFQPADGLPPHLGVSRRSNFRVGASPCGSFCRRCACPS